MLKEMIMSASAPEGWRGSGDPRCLERLMAPIFLMDNKQDEPRGGAGGEPRQDPSGGSIGNFGFKVITDLTHFSLQGAAGRSRRLEFETNRRRERAGIAGNSIQLNQGGKKKIVALISACLILVHCGYRLRGTGSFLPPHVKKVSVPMFKNLTTRFELDVKLTRGVIDELVARGKVEVVTDEEKADAVLIGEITSFTVNPIGFSDRNTADRYSIYIGARIILRESATQKEIFSNPNFVYQEEYEVPQGTDFEGWENQAINKVAEKFARSLVITILEGF
ncbi:MAG: LPS assembly lipoprotein LptE [Candidatus Aminicenantales bacterium]